MKMAPMDLLAFGANRLMKRFNATPPAQPKAAKTVITKAVVEPPVRVDLPPLEFTGSVPSRAPVAPPVVEPQAEAKPIPVERKIPRVSVLEDATRQRIRDRYVAARFPGVARTSADLAIVEAVIKSANLYYEDGDAARAEELLDVAAMLQPEAEALWLARLELALLLCDSENYRRVAISFRSHHPNSVKWPEVAALARSLYLSDAPFAGHEETSGLANFGSYLPPNWLRDSWELAPKFKPADLRLCVIADKLLDDQLEAA